MAYCLKLPKGARVVFHVSLFKKISNTVTTCHELPQPTNDRVIIMEPEAILETQWVKHGTKFVKESLVKWRHLLAKEATWESTELLKNQFQSVELEDKSPPKGGSIDKCRSLRVSRRNLKYE